MSLINQMLQDLEARRSEAPETNAYGQQIRAVPPQRRIHIAWWLALLLGGLLIAVLGWIFLRSPQPVAVPPSAPRPQLPLRFDTAISPVPSAAPSQDSPGRETSGGITVAEPVSPVPAVMEGRPAAQPVEAELKKTNTEPATPAPTKTELTPKTVAAEMPAKAREVPVSAPAPAATMSRVKPVASAAAPARAPAEPIPLHKQVKQLTPQQSAENEYRKASVLIQQGSTTEAIASLEQALQLDPLHSAARQALVGLLLDSKRSDDALRKTREGLALDPGQPGLAMILARLQLDKGELKHAIETLQRTLPHAAERADYQAFLAALLQRDGQHKDAAEHYMLALRKAPQNGVWWMGLGISLQAENRTTEAQEAYNRAKATNSLSPELAQFVDAKLKQLQR